MRFIFTNILEKFRALAERSAFGVCSYLGNWMGIKSSRVRIYFFYATFVTMGSPIIVYLFFAFWLNVKKYISRGRKLIWD